jgi:hypothetical protein
MTGEMTPRGLLTAVVAIIGACLVAWAAEPAYRYLREELFPRFREGDCFVIVSNEKPLGGVVTVIGRHGGHYILMEPDRSTRAMDESQFRDDEWRFNLRFRKVACGGRTSWW